MTSLPEQSPRPDQEPPKSEFVAKLERRWSLGNFVCVGLDSDFPQIPESLKASIPMDTRFGITGYDVETTMFIFNKRIIDATADLVCAYKPNSAFYEAQGDAGDRALERTIKYIKSQYPEIPVILDAKRGDIGNTNLGYIQSAFDRMEADAITVSPYLGKEALQPFLDRKDKGIIVLARTSNPGAGEFQDLLIENEDYPDRGGRTMPFYQYVARRVAEHWNGNGNCAVVVGATYPDELAQVRGIVRDMPILLPGIGAQGGEVEATVKAGKDRRNMGMIINSSRGIIFASKAEDFAQAARAATLTLKHQINFYRTAA